MNDSSVIIMVEPITHPLERKNSSIKSPWRRCPFNTKMVVPVNPEALPVHTTVMENLLSWKKIHGSFCLHTRHKWTPCLIQKLNMAWVLQKIFQKQDKSHNCEVLISCTGIPQGYVTKNDALLWWHTGMLLWVYLIQRLWYTLPVFSLGWCGMTLALMQQDSQGEYSILSQGQ